MYPWWLARNQQVQQQLSCCCDPDLRAPLYMSFLICCICKAQNLGFHPSHTAGIGFPFFHPPYTAKWLTSCLHQCCQVPSSAGLPLAGILFYNRYIIEAQSSIWLRILPMDSYIWILLIGPDTFSEIFKIKTRRISYMNIVLNHFTPRSPPPTSSMFPHFLSNSQILLLWLLLCKFMSVPIYKYSLL